MEREVCRQILPPGAGPAAGGTDPVPTGAGREEGPPGGPAAVLHRHARPAGLLPLAVGVGRL